MSATAYFTCIFWIGACSGCVASMWASYMIFLTPAERAYARLERARKKVITAELELKAITGERHEG